MKLKPVKILTVCLITLVVLSPSIVVSGVVWKQHMELEKTQHLACNVEPISTNKLAFSPNQKSTVLKESSRTNEQFFSIDFAEQYHIAKILYSCVLFIPILLGILTFCYDRYLIHRANVFQQQVEMLEKLWQQSIEQ